MFEFDNAVAVKICGVTNAGDALACAKAGVEMVGLNFSTLSVRCIPATKAREIIDVVRGRFHEIRFVGVFVNQERELVEDLTSELGLDAVQLHGEENLDYVRQLRAPFVIKALRVGAGFTVSNAAAYDRDAILLDTASGQVPGGTGLTFPWPIAVAARRLVGRLFLAGGLNPENVAQAIHVVRPFAVDVSSGIEDAPGRKNHVELQRFVAAVRSTNRVNA